MLEKDLSFGVFERSHYESDLRMQHQRLKKEFQEYRDFLYSINFRWKDDKKKEFFKKHINKCNEDAHSYLYHCETLIDHLEQAREYTTD